MAVDMITAGTTIIAGTYTGDGATSRKINLGFTPAWVLVASKGMTLDGHPQTGYGKVCGGLAVPGSPVKGGAINAVEIVPGGFSVSVETSTGYNDYSLTNNPDTFYNYIAGK